MTDARHSRAINELLLACSVGDLPWLKRGLTSGINPRATNREGLNGLHLAAKNGHFDCLKYLLNNSGLDVNTPTNNGLSPLHCSTMANSDVKMYQCMKLLLDRGADHDIKDVHGLTVLHYVAKNGSMKCIKLLLESGVNIHEKDNNGKTAYELACMHNKYESARLLRALHWAHDKDRARNKKLREDHLMQKRETEEKALQAQLQAQQAEAAYKNWLEEKDFRNRPATPEECEKRMSDTKDRRSSCASCGSSKKRGSAPSRRKQLAPIKVSHHQESKNLKSVGKPDKMQLYTNYRPSSGSSTRSRNKSASPSHSSRCSSSRTNHSMPSGIHFYTKKLRSSAKKDDSSHRDRAAAELKDNVGSFDTYVSKISSSVEDKAGKESSSKLTEQHPTTDPEPTTEGYAHQFDVEDEDSDLDELDFSKLADSNSELAYPQFDFVDDDASLFHDVGELNSLDSLALPAMLTKDKTPAEVLQLLRHLGRSESNKKLRRSNSFSHGSKQLHGHFRRRLSLGSIPEGRILTDYTEEEEEEENDIDSQLLRDLEKSIYAISGTEGEKSEIKSKDSDWSQSITPTSTDGTEELPLSPFKSQSESPEEDIPESESFSMLLPRSDKIAPPQTLKIVNLAWDATSKTVQSRVSETPIASPRGSHRGPSPTQSNKSWQHGATSPHTDTPPRDVAALPLEIISHKIKMEPKATSPSQKAIPPLRKGMPPTRKISPLSRKVTPPPCKDTPPTRKDTPPSRKITPPSRKITPPSRKITPPSRKITPPSHKYTFPSQKVTPPSDDVTQHLSTNSSHLLRPPPLELFRVPSPTSHASDPGMATRLPTSPHTSPRNLSSPTTSLSPASSVKALSCPTMPQYPSVPQFFIGEPERTTDSEVSRPVESHSLFSLSNTAMSRSMVLSSSDLGQGEESGFKPKERSASVPLIRYEHSTDDV